MRRSRSPRPLMPGPGTRALAAVAAAATAATVAVEWARVWRRGSAPLPGDTADLIGAGRTAGLETLEVFREGYRASPRRENTLFNMSAAFAITLGAARATTALIRTGRGPWFLRNLVVLDRHVHHFVPGIVLGFAAGGVAIGTRGSRYDRYLAIPFGAGAALVLDEAALLLELEDVYWSEEGVLSLQISFAALAGLASLALAVRLLRRGEPLVLGDTSAGPYELGDDRPVVAARQREELDGAHAPGRADENVVDGHPGPEPV